MCEMCVTVIYFLLVKLIKVFFSLSLFILLPVTVNKDIQNSRWNVMCTVEMGS